MSKETISFKVQNVEGKHGVKELKQELASFPGVLSVSVNPERNTLAVDFDNTGVDGERIQKRLEKLGYTPTERASEVHEM